jgi:hypothetical protein
VLLVLLAGFVLHANVVGTPQKMFRQSYLLGPTGRVVIQNLYGDVRITAWDREEVLVEAIKRSPDPRRLDDARIVVDSSSELFSIRTQYAGSDAEHPASVEFRITVPRTARLEDVKLINGGLSISGVTGFVRASSVNGNIKAEKLEGQADLSTINGHLEADFNRISRDHPISLSSVNGPITLSIPSATGASLVARNLSGGILSDFGRVARVAGGHRLVVRGYGPTIQVHNVNGGISIHSSWARHSDRPCS